MSKEPVYHDGGSLMVLRGRLFVPLRLGTEREVQKLKNRLGDYQLRSEKAAVNGYASLDGASRVPTAQLGSGTADATTYLRGDQTWQTVSGGGGSLTAATVVCPWPARSEHRVTVVDASVSVASKIIVAWGTVLDTDENGSDMDDVSFRAIPGSGDFVLVAVSPRPFGGAIKINYMVA